MMTTNLFCWYPLVTHWSMLQTLLKGAFFTRFAI